MFSSTLRTLAFCAFMLLSAATPVQHEGQRLIKTSEHDPAKWMTNDEILQLYAQKHRFMDVTETGDYSKRTRVQRFAPISTTPTQKAVADPIVKLASTDLLQSSLTKLSDFNNRYYKSKTGAASSAYLTSLVQDIVKANNVAGLSVTVTPFTHKWGQKSIIAHIDGTDSGKKDVVILGAHQDSINGNDPMNGRAPGADDDGSGSVCLLETLRVILKSGYKPRRALEFHWYSGEEAGLLGSQDIASSYSKSKRQVAGMMQLDMTGFPNAQNPDVGLVTDYTDADLTSLVRNMVNDYTGLQSGDFECSYACSDHASWNRYGYPSVIPFESSNMEENSNIHTENDSLDTVNYDHMLKFVKLAVGYLVELSSK